MPSTNIVVGWAFFSASCFFVFLMSVVFVCFFAWKGRKATKCMRLLTSAGREFFRFNLSALEEKKEEEKSANIFLRYVYSGTFMNDEQPKAKIENIHMVFHSADLQDEAAEHCAELMKNEATFKRTDTWMSKSTVHTDIQPVENLKGSPQHFLNLIKRICKEGVVIVNEEEQRNAINIYFGEETSSFLQEKIQTQASETKDINHEDEKKKKAKENFRGKEGISNLSIPIKEENGLEKNDTNYKNSDEENQNSIAMQNVIINGKEEKKNCEKQNSRTENRDSNNSTYITTTAADFVTKKQNIKSMEGENTQSLEGEEKTTHLQRAGISQQITFRKVKCMGCIIPQNLLSNYPVPKNKRVIIDLILIKADYFFTGDIVLGLASYGYPCFIYPGFIEGSVGFCLSTRKVMIDGISRSVDQTKKCLKTSDKLQLAVTRTKNGEMDAEWLSIQFYLNNELMCDISRYEPLSSDHPLHVCVGACGNVKLRVKFAEKMSIKTSVDDMYGVHTHAGTCTSTPLHGSNRDVPSKIQSPDLHTEEQLIEHLRGRRKEEKEKKEKEKQKEKEKKQETGGARGGGEIVEKK